MMKYMDGDLNERDAALLRDHLAVCGDCEADFDVYDFITGELTEADLTPAPEGFTMSVMSVITTLPQPKKITKQGLDRIVGITAGLVSLLFGVGFLLVLNREGIVEYLSGISALDGVIGVMIPLTESLAERTSGIFATVYDTFLSALNFNRNVLIGIIAVLAVLQGLLYYKKASSGKVQK
jgi:hypothetical protein